MSLYKEGAFEQAAEGFRGARAMGADSVTTTFFLGASLLMAGRTQIAADEFGRASRMAKSAYTAESHFYRAKAFLRLRNVDAALAELAAAAAQDSSIGVGARALADSIQDIH